jgi:hypothetical protein
MRKGVINHASSVCWSGFVMIIELVGLQLQLQLQLLLKSCLRAPEGVTSVKQLTQCLWCLTPASRSLECLEHDIHITNC